MLRQASAMVLTRDSDQGIEVCMLRRVSSSRFAAGAYVFPGGVMEEHDSDPLWPELFVPADASTNKAYQYKIAAIRETFEEAGVLVSGRDHDISVSPDDRDNLNKEKVTLQDIFRQHQLQLNLNEIIFYDHWITPEGAPIRFDTRFYLSIAPSNQHLAHDETETDSSCWATPATLIAQYEKKEIRLMPVTHVQLQRLAAFESVESLISTSKLKKTITAVLPVLHYNEEGKPSSVTIDLEEGVMEYPVFRL